MTVALVDFAKSKGGEMAVTDEFGTWTWSEVNGRINQLVHSLRSLGLEQGDVICLLAGNRHEWLEVFGAAAGSSFELVPMSWHLAPDEVAYILEDSGARAFIADHEYGETATKAASAAGTEFRIAIGGSVDGFADYDDLLAASSTEEPTDQGAGTLMLYTSGTTGRPKGVKSSIVEVGSDPASTLFVLKGLCDLLGLPYEDATVLLNAPAYHAGPLTFCLFPVALGASMVMRRRFDPAETLRLIDDYGVTNVYAVPTHFVRLLKLPEEVRESFDGSSIRCCYHTAAPCPPEVKHQMIDWWGPIINEFYGASESGGAGTLISSEEWLERPGSVGKPGPTTELLIIGEDGEHLGPNEVGQIYLRNLLGVDFEYLGDQQKTEDAHLEPGLFTFGDMGYVDDEGYLFLSDRKIDMIISGGVNIYPAEIEAVLITHPAVADVGVFGIPNEEFGEEVRAAVELMGDAPPQEQVEAELKALAREKLAGFKVPRSFEFGELPRTATGKLLKRQLREPHWEQAGRSI